MKINIENEGTSNISDEAIASDLDNSISEMETRLAEAKAFKESLEDGTLESGDSYLSFGSTLTHGYDRTGPSYWTVASEDEEVDEGDEEEEDEDN